MLEQSLLFVFVLHLIDEDKLDFFLLIPPISKVFQFSVYFLNYEDLVSKTLMVKQYYHCRAPAQLLGPAPASVARVNYSYRYQLTLVCKNSAAIRRLLSYVLAEFSRDRRNKGITALIDVNSYQ